MQKSAIVAPVRTRVLLTFLIALGVLALLASWMYTRATRVGSSYAYVLGEVVDVGAPLEGQVEAVEVQPGQRVKKGEVLARMRASAVRPEVEIARSAYQRAQLAVEDERRAIEVERKKLGVQRVQLGEQVRAAVAEREIARIAAERLDRVASRFARLASRSVGAQADKEDSDSQARGAAAEVVRRRALEHEARAELSSIAVAEASLAARVEHLALLAADVASARAALDAAEARLELTVIRAQGDGRVTRRMRGPGASIRFSDPIAEMTLDGPPAVEAWFDESDLGSLKVGKPVRLTFPGLARTFTGTIDSVAMVSDAEVRSVSVTVPVANRLASARWVRVHVMLDDGDERLVAGLSAEVTVVSPVARPAATLNP